MTRILFFCLGNICRSPMAEFIMKDLVAARGLSDRFFIASAGTSDEETGNPLYPPAARQLDRHQVAHTLHSARQLQKSDLCEYDLLVGMEARNLASARRMLGDSPKLQRLLDYTSSPHDIADPWYTGDFDTAYREIREGCEALLMRLCPQHNT